MLYIGNVDSSEMKNLEFIINGETEANGNVTVNPQETLPLDHPTSMKYGYPSPVKVVNGYYIFEWNILLNADENSNNTGFNTLENFSFEDVIPQDSPHVFITSTLAEELNIPSSYREITVKEYTGSDLEAPEDRYYTFLTRYWYVGGDLWVNYLSSHTLANGVTSTGIDGKNGLNISDVIITNKLFSAELGTLTRPTLIHYYTIATIKLSESSLGDPETVTFFKNTFIGSNKESLNADLSEYYFASGGSAKGVLGDYSFTFTKVSENGNVLPDALYSLYTNETCTGGADRFSYSDNNGIVAFNNLAEGIYYFQETIPPEEYTLNNSIYKVEISTQGFIIYYGDNFENRLSDQGNRIINKLELTEPPETGQPETGQPETEVIEPIYVTITATKILSGKTLEDGIFMFALKDADGNTIDIGTNDKNGKITFNALPYTTEGKYIYTVTEIRGDEFGIDYSDKAYTVKVTVTQNNDKTLIATTEYPDGGIVFLNTYSEKITGGVHLTKYGRDKSIKLFVAGFKLYHENGDFIGTYITNEEGLIEVDNLDYGTFYFVESNAPDGYVSDTEKIYFTLDDDTTRNGTAYVELEKTNKLKMVAPQTGEDTNIGVYITLLILTTGIILIILLHDPKLRKK